MMVTCEWSLQLIFSLTFFPFRLRRERTAWWAPGRQPWLTHHTGLLSPSHFSCTTFLLGWFKGTSASNIQTKLTIWKLPADSIMIRVLMPWRGESSRTGGSGLTTYWLQSEPTSQNEQYYSFIGKYPFNTSKYQSSSALTQFLLLGLLDCYYRSLTKRHQVLAIRSLTSCRN